MIATTKRTMTEELRNDEGIKALDSLQTLLQNLEPSSVAETIDGINNLGYTDENMRNRLVKNIYLISRVRPSSLSSFVELIVKLDLMNLIRSNFQFASAFGCYSLLNVLIEKELLEECEVKNAIPDYFISSQQEIYSIFLRDDFDQFLEIASSPEFDKNAVVVDRSIGNTFDDIIRVRLIQYAAYYGAFKCFKYLFINDADTSGDYRLTSYAAAGGNLDIITLLETSGHPVNEKDIMTAIRHHHPEIFDWFLEKYPDLINNESIIKTCIEDHFIHGILAFESLDADKVSMLACKNWFVELVGFFNHHSAVSYEGFVNAARNGIVDVLQEFITLEGFNVNQVVNNTTALIEAVGRQKLEAVNLLLSAPGIDVNQKILLEDRKSEICALIIAIRLKYDKIVQRLLKTPGIDPNIMIFNGKTNTFPLLEGIGDSYVVQYLLECPGIDVNKKSGHNFPLYSAAKCRELGSLTLLANRDDLRISAKVIFIFMSLRLLASY